MQFLQVTWLCTATWNEQYKALYISYKSAIFTFHSCLIAFIFLWISPDITAINHLVTMQIKFLVSVDGAKWTFTSHSCLMASVFLQIQPNLRSINDLIVMQIRLLLIIHDVKRLQMWLCDILGLGEMLFPSNYDASANAIWNFFWQCTVFQKSCYQKTLSM
jgi:hypothetical protein